MDRENLRPLPGLRGEVLQPGRLLYRHRPHGLALHKEYYDQLKLVQEHIGFSHIRGHGLFCDDMAIYQEYKNARGRR